MSKIVLAEQASAPDTPGSGKVALFVDTNGDLCWKDDAGNVIKVAAAGSYTLTIPATGTAALLGTAQTFSAVKTFDNALVAPGMKPASDSTTALQLQKSNGTAVLTVDTTNSKVNLAALQLGGVDVPFAADVWTPVLKFGGATTGITYSTQSGYYLRFGNLVAIWASIALTNKGSATGAAQITGLPIATSGILAPLSVVWTAVGTGVYLYSLASGSAIALYVVAGGTGISTMTDASFTNTTTLYIGGVYRA